jgi:hypothetical protein
MKKTTTKQDDAPKTDTTNTEDAMKKTTTKTDDAPKGDDPKPDAAKPDAPQPDGKPAVKLTELATTIKAEHQAVVTTYRKSLDHARRAGELLAKAKKEVDESAFQWAKWVEKECGIIERTASNYLRIYHKWADVEAKVDEQGGDIARLTVRAALSLLNPKAKPKPGQPKQKVTLATLKERMEQHGIEGDPAELLELLKEIGLNLKVAEEELAAVA